MQWPIVEAGGRGDELVEVRAHAQHLFEGLVELPGGLVVVVGEQQRHDFATEAVEVDRLHRLGAFQLEVHDLAPGGGSPGKDVGLRGQCSREETSGLLAPAGGDSDHVRTVVEQALNPGDGGQRVLLVVEAELQKIAFPQCLFGLGLHFRGVRTGDGHHDPG
jgi:hypothetical protein